MKKPFTLPVKRTWMETAINIQYYHVMKLKENLKWRVEDTAKDLKRSKSAVSQYLLIASWLRSHENQLRRLRTMEDALEFIRKHKHDLLISEIE